MLRGFKSTQEFKNILWSRSWAGMMDPMREKGQIRLFHGLSSGFLIHLYLFSTGFRNVLCLQEVLNKHLLNASQRRNG